MILQCLSSAIQHVSWNLYSFSSSEVFTLSILGWTDIQMDKKSIEIVLVKINHPLENKIPFPVQHIHPPIDAKFHKISMFFPGALGWRVHQFQTSMEKCGSPRFFFGQNIPGFQPIEIQPLKISKKDQSLWSWFYVLKIILQPPFQIGGLDHVISRQVQGGIPRSISPWIPPARSWHTKRQGIQGWGEGLGLGSSTEKNIALWCNIYI